MRPNTSLKLTRYGSLARTLAVIPTRRAHSKRAMNIEAITLPATDADQFELKLRVEGLRPRSEVTSPKALGPSEYIKVTSGSNVATSGGAPQVTFHIRRR